MHEDVDWVLQADQLGTGHAVMQAMCVIPDEHTVLVLYGDVPLIGGAIPHETDRGRRRRRARRAVRSISTKPRAMGASCAMPQGQVTRHRRAQGCERRSSSQIREVNSGLMAAPAGRLREWLLGLGRNNIAARVLI